MLPSTTDGRPALGTQAIGDAAGRRQVAQGLAHLDRAGGAVEADHVDLHGVEDGEGGADLGAGEHAAGQLDGHLGLQRHAAAERDHGPAGAVDGGLDRQQVEYGLDERGGRRRPRGGRGPAPRRRRGDRRSGSVRGSGTWCPGRCSRPPSAAARAWRTRRPPAGPARRPAAVQLAGPVGQPVLGQHGAKRAERVGLDDVAADLEEGAVDLGDDVGPGDRRGSRCSPRARARRSPRGSARAAAGWCPWRRRRSTHPLGSACR